jgi:signal transduction histidine kinase
MVGRRCATEGVAGYIPRSTPDGAGRTYPDRVSSLIERVRRVPPGAVDGLLATFSTVLAQVELHTSADDGYRGGPLWLNSPLEVVFTMLLLLRTARPRVTLALMCAWLVLPTLVTTHTLLFWGNFLPLMLVNYTVARVDRGWLGRWSWLVCTACVMTMALRFPDLRSPVSAAFPLVMFGAPSALGVLVRRLAAQRADLARALAELADQQQLREVEAVEAERRRIAAEMHDVVAHAVSLMAVQVGAARLQLESGGVDVPPQLRAAEETGRRAVADLRRSLGVVRGASAPVDLDPVPDLSALPGLVRRFEDAGLKIELACTDTDGLPASLQLAAYRIVQESLTNVLKHAGQVPVAVRVDRSEDVVDVRVVNRAGTAPSATAGAGHGLTGMQERVGMYDGALVAGETADGGFEVRARLVLTRSAEPTGVRP